MHNVISLVVQIWNWFLCISNFNAFQSKRIIIVKVNLPATLSQLQENNSDVSNHQVHHRSFIQIQTLEVVLKLPNQKFFFLLANIEYEKRVKCLIIAKCYVGLGYQFIHTKEFNFKQGCLTINPRQFHGWRTTNYNQLRGIDLSLALHKHFLDSHNRSRMDFLFDHHL